MGKSEICGGYTITIQNYARAGEFKYNVYNTADKKIWQSNSIYEFVEKLEEILNEE